MYKNQKIIFNYLIKYNKKYFLKINPFFNSLEKKVLLSWVKNGG